MYLLILSAIPSLYFQQKRMVVRYLCTRTLCHGPEHFLLPAILYPEYKAVGLISAPSSPCPDLFAIHPNLFRLTIDIGRERDIYILPIPRLDLLLSALVLSTALPYHSYKPSPSPSLQIERGNGLVVQKQVTLPTLDSKNSMLV